MCKPFSRVQNFKICRLFIGSHRFLLEGLKRSGVVGPWSLPQEAEFSRELEMNQFLENLGHGKVGLQHVVMLDVFSGRCCYKTSLICSTGVLECWNDFKKDQLFTAKWNAK